MVDTPHDTTPHAAPSPQDEDPLPARRRAARLAHHLTIADLAQRTGLPACVIRRLERREQRLTVQHIVTLARGLGMRVPELLGTEDVAAVMRRLARYLSPQAREAVAALMCDWQRLPPGSFSFPVQSR